MRKRCIALAPAILFFLSTTAQTIDYRLTGIPDSLKSKAGVIVQFENYEYEVESLDRASLSVHRIFTVLSDEGKQALLFNIYTSKYISLDEAEIKVMDGNGKQVEKYKKKDMVTQAIGDGLIDDGYVTYLPIKVSSYPSTVEIKYQQKFKSTLSTPSYQIISPGESIIESNYTARVPRDIGLSYKAVNAALEPVISEEGKDLVYRWRVYNLAAIKQEEGSVAGLSRYPHVKIKTNKFSHYGYQGDFSSWQHFGNWIKQLFDGLDVLPAERQQFFVTLVQGATDEQEKIRRIYNYLQQNFRYVSIQLGIGGYRPFSAEFTDKKKYGDCKALSNYMKAALKCVGIPSQVAVINAAYNEAPVDPSFPVNSFNHMILCVPRAKDSIWLECTSSTAEFGELGTFTENRNALLITDQGGVLVPTPTSHSTTNTLLSHSIVSVAEDLSAITETSLNAKGNFRELLDDVIKEKKDRQKEFLVYYFGFKHPDDFIIEKENTPGKPIIHIKMALEKLPEFTAGDKLFISPRINKIFSARLPKSDNRKLDFYFSSPFEKIDTTVFTLPAGFKPDVMAKETDLSSAYAAYKSRSWYNAGENAIYSTTSLILKQHRIPAADYAGVKKFFDELAQDDTQRIVILKTEAVKKAF